ncbi:hypothetical protein DEM26_17600 [Thioclava sp. NG1]|nr:hypothetical protein DEM26_17600 [Thioclava sp. NG1]
MSATSAAIITPPRIEAGLFLHRPDVLRPVSFRLAERQTTSAMRYRSSFLLIWLAFALVTSTLLPTRSFAEQTVSDWLGVANAQLAQGKPGRALLIFGEIASRHPEFSPAQAGLEQSFRKLGSVRRNEAFLRYALAKDPKHEDALLAAWQSLDRAHPLRFSATASILPSSNVDHVASERYLVTDFGTFLIKDGGNETSGVGLGYGANLDWFIQPRPGHRIRFRASYAGAWYHTATLRYSEPGLAVQYEHLGRRGPWSVEAFVRDRRYGGGSQDITSDNLTRGVRFAKAWRSVADGRTVFRLGGEYASYGEKSYLSGPRYYVDLARRTRVGRRGALSYGLRLERAVPRTDYHRYSGAELRVGFERPLIAGVRGGLSLSYGERRYDAAFPIVGVHRRDRAASLGLSLELKRVKILGQTPRISCTARRTRSNVALYTTNSVDCAFSLKLDF